MVQGFGIDSYGDVVGVCGAAGGSASKRDAFYVPYEGAGRGARWLISAT